MHLRPATVEDVPFFLKLEQQYRQAGFVAGDSAETHGRQLSELDCLYRIAEQGGERAGYFILRGLQSPNRSIELKRIAVASVGEGLGRKILAAVTKIAFHDLVAHRLWLDVFVENTRARHLYREVGFQEDGLLRECILHGDQYRSLVVMSMLEAEYRKLAATKL